MILTLDFIHYFLVNY